MVVYLILSKKIPEYKVSQDIKGQLVIAVFYLIFDVLHEIG